MQNDTQPIAISAIHAMPKLMCKVIGKIIEKKNSEKMENKTIKIRLNVFIFTSLLKI
jgi:hypothetical protein